MSDFIPLEWDLPWHILVDILGRIPAESVARCSCVATSWQEVTNGESFLKRKIGLERAWLHDPIEPKVIHRTENDFTTYCCVKMENFIALGGYHGFKVFDFDRKELIFYSGEIGSIWSLSFMDGMLVTGGGEGYLCGWDISTWERLFYVPIFDSGILSFANLGDNVAVAGEDRDLQVWRKGVWEFDRSLQGHQGNVHCILPQPGNLLISGSKDETIRIWNLADNACLRVIRRQKQGAFSLDMSDGHIFCGAFDGNIRSWECESGQHVQTFRGHTKIVTSVIIKEDRMFTGSDDGTIKIWDATKGKCVRTLDCRFDRDQVLQCAQEKVETIEGIWVDDEKLVAVCGNGEIWEWDFSDGL